MNDISKYKQLNIDNYIITIFIILSILELISNIYEKNYYDNKNMSYKKVYKNINIFVISITLLINIYYFIYNYKGLEKSDNIFKKLGVLASSCLVLSSIISLFIEVYGKDDDSELIFF